MDFEVHKNKDHNLNNYIYYLVLLKFIEEKDMDSDQSIIDKKIKSNDVGIFPINKCYELSKFEEF